MKPEVRRSFWRLNNPIIWGTLATFLVLGAGIYLGSLPHCQYNQNITSDCPSKFTALFSSPLNEVGDTLSGFAGSLAFVWLFVATLLQSQELGEQRDQLKAQTDEFEKSNAAYAAQRFDSNFFSMLSTHSEIVNAMDVEWYGSKSGRDCFTAFRDKLNESYSNRVRSGVQGEEERIRLAYADFWVQHQANLGHYFRFLFNVFRFLDEATFVEGFHARLIRSQLSDQELMILFYNCLSDVGSPFKRYAVRFALFDNLPLSMLIDLSHATLVDLPAWGKNPGRLALDP